MQDLLLLLLNFFIIGLIVNLTTSTFVEIVKPFINLRKYSLVVAFAFSSLIIVTYNKGILTTLDVPQEFTLLPYFHWVDLLVSSVIFAKGSQVVHRILEALQNYRATPDPDTTIVSQKTITTESDKIEQTNVNTL